MSLTFGFELEVNSGAEDLIYCLRQQGLMATEYLHNYHCTCVQCRVLPTNDFPRDDYGERIYGASRVRSTPPDLHAQRDSTVNGEVISRVFNNFTHLRRVALGLEAGIREAQATVASNCGLHVHVSAYGRTRLDREPNTYNVLNLDVPLAWLFVERYLSEMVAPGATSAKREMNMTLMQTLRNYSGGQWEYTDRRQIGNALVRAIASDRHVDLNLSERNRTWEVRVFNAPTQAWRIELAARLSVAFIVRASAIVDATLETFSLENLRPLVVNGSRWTTMRPRITLGRLIDILCEGDDKLRELVMRQCDFMRSRYRREIFDETLLPEDNNEQQRPTPYPSDADLFIARRQWADARVLIRRMSPDERYARWMDGGWDPVDSSHLPGLSEALTARARLHEREEWMLDSDCDNMLDAFNWLMANYDTRWAERHGVTARTARQRRQAAESLYRRPPSMMPVDPDPPITDEEWAALTIVDAQPLTIEVEPEDGDTTFTIQWGGDDPDGNELWDDFGNSAIDPNTLSYDQRRMRWGAGCVDQPLEYDGMTCNCDDCRESRARQRRDSAERQGRTMDQHFDAVCRATQPTWWAANRPPTPTPTPVLNQPPQWLTYNYTAPTTRYEPITFTRFGESTAFTTPINNSIAATRAYDSPRLADNERLAEALRSWQTVVGVSDEEIDLQPTEEPA